MSDLRDELDSLDVTLLIEFGVAEEDRDKALAVYERFKNNPVAVRLLHSYYSDLPEAREEVAVDLRVVAEKQGSTLAVLQTPSHAYLYVIADDQALFIEEFERGVKDQTLLTHFDFHSSEDFRTKIGTDPDKLPVLSGDDSADQKVCVACGVQPGEFHMLGCPVERCPWCESQLSACNCRFDQLGLTSIDDEEQLARFEDLLEAKGRIPFKATDNPSYPTAGDDPPPF